IPTAIRRLFNGSASAGELNAATVIGFMEGTLRPFRLNATCKKIAFWRKDLLAISAGSDKKPAFQKQQLHDWSTRLMQTYQPGDIRNFAIVGHASSGKTMLSEAMLVCGGVFHRMGSIASATTVSDYHESERQRKISVQASLLHTEWLGKKFNIIDTPGYLDFISEGLGALRVGDFALVVVHANHGVGVGTQQVWEYADRYGIPKMIVINALDREDGRFDDVFQQIRDRFGA